MGGSLELPLRDQLVLENRQNSLIPLMISSHFLKDRLSILPPEPPATPSASWSLNVTRLCSIHTCHLHSTGYYLRSQMQRLKLVFRYSPDRQIPCLHSLPPAPRSRPDFQARLALACNSLFSTYVVIDTILYTWFHEREGV